MRTIAFPAVFRSLATPRLLAAVLLALVPYRVGSADVVRLVASSPTVAPGGSVTVSENVTFDANDAVFLNNGYNLGSFDIAMLYDSTRFTISNVTLGSLVSGDFMGSFTTSTPGQLTGTSNTLGTGVPVAVGQTGTLLTFVLTAKNTAPAGPGDLNLVPMIGNTSTNEVFYNPTTFDTQTAVHTLPVTAGFDPGVDTTVTVVTASIPEPSPLILSGVVGTAFLLLAARRRLRSKT